MSDHETAIGALRALRDTVDELIASGLTGDPEQQVDTLGEAYHPAMQSLFDLWPDDEPEDADEEPTGPVVTVRTRADYVIDDLDAVVGDHGDLATAMYERLHDQGLDRFLDEPGLRLAIAVTIVHSGSEALELPEDDVELTDLLEVDDDERELRGIIDVF